ncbi:MAG: helix-turn-helix domain-containing protein [Clostridia bacterium]|nr:helix-turn-helix domain-containing protein [Clostridia bacterium]
MSKKKIEDIPLSIIEDAVKGKSYALQFILSHFHSYIKTLATRVYEDGQGNKHSFVDEDIVSRLEAKLVLSIVNDFVIPY